MTWAKPEFDNSRVDAAGRELLKLELSESEFEDALAVINNWRASHTYPLLSMRVTLEGRAKRIYPSAAVVQRLKRLHSIRQKLKREKSMRLTQMQDIGGLRAIVRTVAEVDRLVETYEEATRKNPNRGPELFKKHDYIARPKPDGYRSVHLIYKYRTASMERRAYDGLRIEIQVRSPLQQAWATSVETVSTFTDQALKYSLGEEDWKRFFILMGSAIALREKRPTVAGTPSAPAVLKRELRDICGRINAEATLQGLGAAASMSDEKLKSGYWYLLVLDPTAKTLRVESFSKEEGPKAEAAYAAEEKQIGSTPGVQAVLVSASSISALKKAYANFYLDSAAFIEAVRYALS